MLKGAAKPVSRRSQMTRIAIPLEEPRRTDRRPVMLQSGHRPFFLFAALSAPAMLLAWLVSLHHGLLPLGVEWHAHEMVFGFGIAAISGFLMAAVPKWTGRPGIDGGRLVLLIVLWLAGRAGMLVEGWHWLDALFLPVFATFILADILAARNARNYPVPAILFALAGLNLAWHAAESWTALHAAIYLVTALIALIGGRVVPAFTQNALRMSVSRDITCTTPEWLDRLAVPAVVLVVVTELLAPQSMASGAAALVAGLLLLVRMAGWQSFRTLKLPLVWILHAGYVWIPIGFMLKAAADLGGWVEPSAALHALTAGAVGTMIMAVASRAALGHSGRPLVPSRWTVASYVLVIAAALFRVFAPGEIGIEAGGLLWALGWTIFAIVYWPILTRRRVDGLPG